MLILYVSYDAGSSYQEEGRAETNEPLLQKLKEVNPDGIYRWTIEDEEGNFEAVTPLFDEIIDTVGRARILDSREDDILGRDEAWDRY